MLLAYIDRALRKAKYEALEDGTFVGTVPGLRGVLANAATLAACREQLAEVIESWVLFRGAKGMRVPPVDGVRILVTRVAAKPRRQAPPSAV